MLKKLLEKSAFLSQKGQPLYPFRALIQATDAFLYEAPVATKRAPHIRDAIDIKRWMIMVVIALLPCFFMAIWNTGIQKYVYSSFDFKLMDQFLESSHSFSKYISFALENNRWISILEMGCMAVLPVLFISYAVGGFWEAIFATYRGHEISEGFLVTGILYALILPPTIPYWMVAFGVSVGVILAKEVFGGSGMNIVNPALACRAFLFFSFPGKMSGNVWVGTNPTVIQDSLLKMNHDAGKTALDGYTQATPLSVFNVTPEIKKIHIDALATNDVGEAVTTYPYIEKAFQKWSALQEGALELGNLTADQLKSFVTAPLSEGGLNLSVGYFEDASYFSSLNYGLGNYSDLGFFFGNKLGSMGETSGFCCLLGAIFLIYTEIASWRTILGMFLGAFGMALLFQYIPYYLGEYHGALLPSQFGFPAYKHLLMGGLCFGAVFMATDPVSSPTMNKAKWIYGLFCGIVTMIIRVINPAYPEGVMLAILMGNTFAPLFDYYAAKSYRKRRRWFGRSI